MLRSAPRRVTLRLMDNAALTKATEAVGGIAALGRLLGLCRQTVQNWGKHDRQIPAKHIVEIERLTGVPREELRPDLYVPRKRSQ
jgi:DNA-binding transcriptional regulator YdaS (Cro superfamily)